MSLPVGHGSLPRLADKGQDGECKLRIGRELMHALAAVRILRRCWGGCWGRRRPPPTLFVCLFDDRSFCVALAVC